MLPAPAALPLSPPLTTTPSLPTPLASQWAQAFNLWLNSCSSPHTRRAYSFAWSAFQSYTGKLPWEVTRSDIALWLDSQRASSLSASTINQRLAALSSFFTYASQVFMVRSPDASERPLSSTNPVQSIPRLKSPSYNKSRYLTVPEARALLRTIPRHTIQGLRDYALFLTYLVTGRRNSEIRILRYGDFEFDSIFLSGDNGNKLMSLVSYREGIIKQKGHGRSIVIWSKRPFRSSDRRVRHRNSPNSC